MATSDISTNSRIGTAFNLEQGGTYDLLMIQYTGAYPEGKISFGVGNTPMKITGVQKVAQTFMKLLMTSKGSDVIYPLRGTELPYLVLNANISQEDSAVYSEIISAVKDAEVQTRYSMNSSETDTSSMLRQASVLGLDIGDESITMYVQIETMDGMTASVAVPFPEFGLYK